MKRCLSLLIAMSMLFVCFGSIAESIETTTEETTPYFVNESTIITSDIISNDPIIIVAHDENNSDVKLKNIIIQAEGSQTCGLEARAENQSSLTVETADVSVQNKNSESDTYTYGVGVTTYADSTVQLTTGDIAIQSTNDGNSYTYGLDASAYSHSTLTVETADISVQSESSDSYADAYGVSVSVDNDSTAQITTGDISIQSTSYENTDCAGIYVDNVGGNVCVNTGSISAEVTAEDYIGGVEGVVIFGCGTNVVNVNGDISLTANGKVQRGVHGVNIRADNAQVTVSGDVNAPIYATVVAPYPEDQEYPGPSVTDAPQLMTLNETDGDGNESAEVPNSITIAIEGTLSSAENPAIMIQVFNPYGDMDAERLADALPEIIVYEIDADTIAEVSVCVPNYQLLSDEDEDPEPSEDDGKDPADVMTEMLKATIQYIIHNESNLAIKGASGSYTSLAGKEFQTATTQDTLIVTVGDDVESLTAGKYAVVTKNDDGTYTIKVCDGGDLNLEVVVKVVPEPKPEPKPEKKLPVKLPDLTIGQVVTFGSYDFDGDGVAEPVEWKVSRLRSMTIGLTMVNGFEAPVDDLLAAIDFSEEERAAIVDINDAIPTVAWETDAEGSHAAIRVWADAIALLGTK